MHPLLYNSDSNRFFPALIFTVCFSIFFLLIFAESTIAQAADWQPIFVESISAREYQPVLDAFQQLSGTDEGESFYSLARTYYTDIQCNQPGSDDAFYAQKTLLLLQISKKDPAANQTLEQFLTGFSGHPDLVKAIRQAGDIYFYLGKSPSKAQVIYQQILTGRPNSPECIWAQRGLVMTALENRDYAAADSAVESLLLNYADHPQINTAVRVVADRYFYANDFHQAQRLYKWVAERHPGIEAIWVQRGLVTTHLHLAEYEEVASALEILRNVYSEHPQFDAALRAAADEYFYWGSSPNTAQSLYEQILREHPDGPEAIWAQRGLVLTGLELGDKVTADAAMQKLLVNYADHPQIATAVRIAADRYFYYGNDPERACSLYEKILSDWPNSCEKMSAQRGLAMARVQLGEETAQTAAEILVSDFANREELSENTGEIIDQYCRAGNPEKVIALSEKILSENPNRPMELAAHTGLARAYILTGQQTQAQQHIDLILTGYPQEERFGYALFVIGEQYYTQGMQDKSENRDSMSQEAFARALTVWTKVREQSTDPFHQAHATYYTAVIHQEMKQYEEAIPFFQQVLDQWPAYKKAWYAQFMIARCYEELVRENKAFIASVREAYQRLIEQYPDCSAASLAVKKLERM